MNPRTLFAGLFSVLMASPAVAGDDGVIRAPRACTDFSGNYSGMGCEGTLRQRAPFELKQLGCQTLILLDREPSIPMVFHLAASEEQTIRFEPNTHTEEAQVRMKREARWLDGRARLSLKIEAAERVKERGGEARTSTSLTELTLSRREDGALQVEGRSAVPDASGALQETERGTCLYRAR